MEKRDLRIDFFRGIALLMIFTDHVPKSVGWLVTLRSWSFADAAELFFFVSGFIAATVYLPVMRDRGFVAALVRIWRRAWDVYAAQMVLFVFVVAEISLAVALTHRAGYYDYFRVQGFMMQTDAAIWRAITLAFQPAYLDILPVYVIFFFALPFVLAALRRAPLAVLCASLALYLAAQLWDFTPRTWPLNQGWFFNPFAWQFLFVLGASFALPDVRALFPRADSKWVWRIALAIVVPTVAMEITTTLHDFWPMIPALSSTGLPVTKASLEWLRIVSFLATAVLALRIVPQGQVLNRYWLGRAIIRCGQHSLPVFCLGVVLAVAAHVVWNEERSMWLQFACTVAGLAFTLAFAALHGWIKTAERPRALAAA
ncbi:MAG TPA: OpgC domain-containing protein [Rhizomicrobium sp.]|jgi:hypothetical protein|nr:OpgC domain-containing protein [Rhizomicrobium sp.]